uniref:CD74 molecule, major histocompatibility complex, class II invariant chain a n=1 Tax=Cyprinus carpio carpio TaxID=630221 RepID=A0A8C1EEA3_CYPCA
MDEHQDQALFQRVPSQETVVNRGGTGGSNGQALTAYLVWGQKEHISALTTGQEKLKTELTRKMSGAPPKAMHLPMKSMPLLKDFSDDSSDQTSKKSSVPLTKLQPIFTNQKEGSGQLDASRLMPKQMQLPMRSLPLLMDTDDDVKSTPESAVEVQSKCQLESQKQMKPGFYKPQCDEQGNYLPMQCWHSTGYCWCVDKNGNEIPGTSVRGRRPDCS